MREYRLEAPALEYGHLRIRMEFGCILDRDLDSFYHGIGTLPRVFGSTLVGTVVEGEGRARIIAFRGGVVHAPKPGTKVMVFFDEAEATVVLVDPSRPRLQHAEELGIQHTINPIAGALEWEHLVSRSVPLCEIPSVVPEIMGEPGTFPRLIGYVS